MQFYFYFLSNCAISDFLVYLPLVIGLTAFILNRYKFLIELDFPHDIVYEVMCPPQNPKDKLSWDKSVKDYETLAIISQVCC